METPQHRPPRSAVKGTANGLIMMAVFTLIWSVIAYRGFADTPYQPILLIFAIAAVVFIINAVQLFRLADFFSSGNIP